MIKTILFAPATFNLAETTRMIEIAKVLRQEYNCIFCGFSERYSPLIQEVGFEFSLLSPKWTAQQEAAIMAFDQGKSLKNPFTETIVAERVASEGRLIQQTAPLVIVTGSNVTIFLSARIKEIPLVYVKPVALSRPHMNHRPACVIPSQLKKTYLPGKLLWHGFLEVSQRLTWKPRAFKKVAQHYDLKLPKYTLEMLDGDLNLITTLPAFTAELDFPANYRSVGPIYAHLPYEIPERALQVIETARRKKKQVVYFAMGSSGERSLIEKVLRYFETTEFEVIAPIKSYLEDTPTARNIHVFDWLPAFELSKHVDFSVIHGGEGTVQTACASGKPFIGIGLQYEQEVNVAYCEAFGNAIALPPNRLAPQTLDHCIRRLSTGEVQEKAREMQQLMAHAKGAQNAAEQIKQTYL